MLDKSSRPEEIERRSFEIIDGEIGEPRPFTGALWTIARRCIHALGDTSILGDLRINQDAMQSGVAAMRRGCTIFTDTTMLAAGLVARRMKPLGITVQPLMAMPGLEKTAQQEGITRAKAGIMQISRHMNGQIVAIGNAPTALLGLLEAIEAGAQPPALIVGMPVGFVNAAQSKDLLQASSLHHFTLLGRKGGSAAAAACVNALADIALVSR